MTTKLSFIVMFVLSLTRQHNPVPVAGYGCTLDKTLKHCIVLNLWFQCGCPATYANLRGFVSYICNCA
jgi:hypothetical protein